MDSVQHGNSESHARLGVTAAWPCQESGHADQTANLKLPTKRCGAVGIPPRSRVGGGQTPVFGSVLASTAIIRWNVCGLLCRVSILLCVICTPLCQAHAFCVDWPYYISSYSACSCFVCVLQSTCNVSTNNHIVVFDGIVSRTPDLLWTVTLSASSILLWTAIDSPLAGPCMDGCY